jgi:hypothetical protein
MTAQTCELIPRDKTGWPTTQRNKGGDIYYFDFGILFDFDFAILFVLSDLGVVPSPEYIPHPTAHTIHNHPTHFLPTVFCFFVFSFFT